MRSLATAGDVRRFLGKMMRAHLRQEISSDTLRAITYSATALLKAMEHETIDFEISSIRKRLEEIQQ